MGLPAKIGDYTDFFVSKYHTQNCNDIFRNTRKVFDNWCAPAVSTAGPWILALHRHRTRRNRTRRIPGCPHAHLDDFGW